MKWNELKWNENETNRKRNETCAVLCWCWRRGLDDGNRRRRRHQSKMMKTGTSYIGLETCFRTDVHTKLRISSFFFNFFFCLVTSTTQMRTHTETTCNCDVNMPSSTATCVCVRTWFLKRRKLVFTQIECRWFKSLQTTSFRPPKFSFLYFLKRFPYNYDRCTDAFSISSPVFWWWR